MTPELAAATRIVSGGKASKPLEQVAKARAAGQAETRGFIQGGATPTEAMGATAVSKRELQAATSPLRTAELNKADIGRTQIIPAERQAAQLRDAAAAEAQRAKRFLMASDEEAMRLAQMDDLGDAFNPAAINVQRGRVGALEQRGGQMGARSVDLGAQARAADEVAANLRAQGLKPLDISGVVGRLRASAADAEFVNPARYRVLSAFADNLENRAARYGGVIDATGLYELRKNMGNVVSDILGPTEPNALQQYTAQIIGETQPLIDDAIEAAGGKGWREYLNTFSQGMRNIERQQFERVTAALPEARFAKVMGGQDPDFVSKFFGPGRFDINVEMFGPKLGAAHGLASDINATRAVAQTGLEDLATSQKLGLATGARERAAEAMEPGVANMFVRGLSRITGGLPGMYGGGQFATEAERELANKLYANAMTRLAPALAQPSEASRLLQVRPMAEMLGDRSLNLLPPSARNYIAQLAAQYSTRPMYTTGE